jgi:hypothetical protein
MFLLVAIAVLALVGIVLSVRAVISDGPQRVKTRDNLLAR